MKDLWHLKREFLENCEIEKGQSLLTIENYDRYLTRFLRWLEKHSEETAVEEDRVPDPEAGGLDASIAKNFPLTPELITQEVVREYRLYINRLTAKNGQELKGSTQNHHALALRAFLRYLSMHSHSSLPPEKVTLAKTGDREVTFLNLEEYERLLSIPNVEKIDGLRDKALLEVLFSTGMRVSELIALNVGQINFQRGEIAVLGKGKKLRVVFLSDQAKELLIKYLTARGIVKVELSPQSEESALKTENNNEPILNSKFLILNSSENEPLFISTRENRVNARGIERMISKYAKAAGISKQVTPHTLRHTFATDLLSAGADIRSVQSLLGHSNISTTQVYTHVTDSHLREIHQKFHNSNKEVSSRTDDTA